MVKGLKTKFSSAVKRRFQNGFAPIIRRKRQIRKLKPSQNKKGRKNFQLHCFLNTFSQLPAVKKYSKNGAAGKIFDPALA